MFCSKCGTKIESNEQYCPKCGFLVNNQNNIQSNNQSINNNKKQHLLIGIICVVIVVLLSSIIILMFKDNIYFNLNSYFNNDQDYISDSSENNNPYHTAIVYDRVYRGLDYSNIEKANKIIIDDSVTQKKSCPKEIIEIEKRIISKYGITAANLCELDKDFALDLEGVIKTIYDDFPTARGYLTNITLVNAKLTDSYIAAFMPFFPFVYPDTGSRYLIKTQILLNSAYFLNIQRMEASIKNAVEVGHFPPNSNRYSTVAHEFGHYLSFLAMMKENKLDYVLISDLDSDTFIKSANAFADGSFSLKMMTEAYENYKSKTNTSMSLLEFRSSISAYAVAKDNKGEYIYDETIAEAFHDYYLNKNKSKDASKEIVSVLNKYLGGS